jgi:mRNA interferase RelE/StbE
VGKYKVLIKPSAAKELASIRKEALGRIVRRILSLANDPRPHGSEKLSGEDKYRIRQGNYRIVYAIEDEAHTVTVVKVGHRREVYK